MPEPIRRKNFVNANEKRGRKPSLTQAQIDEVREMYAVKTGPGWTVHGIAHYMKVSEATINKALNGTLKARKMNKIEIIGTVTPESLKKEDGGQALICEGLDNVVTTGADHYFFVKLQSWNEDECYDPREPFHPTLNSMKGKRIKITIEEV